MKYSHFEHPAKLVARWHECIELSEHIFTWTEPEALALCAEIATECDNMIESGTYHGRSAKVMLDAGVKHLWCVDHFSDPNCFEVCSHMLRKEIKEGRCELIKGDSAKAGGMLQHMKGKIDAVWVDDGHAEVDLQRDIDNLLPLIRPGGIIFGHDYEVPANDVARGVLSRIPHEKLIFPVPRVWAYIVP